MKKETSINELYELPSKGLFNSISGQFTLRSMTTMEEKKRLSVNHTAQYKILSEIINDCVTEPENFNSYDLCLGDFQYLLFKLRTVTYGSKYKFSITCPFCHNSTDEIIDLDELEVFSYSDEIESQLEITLPRSKDRVKISLLTPRKMDYIFSRSKEILSKNKDYEGSPSYLLTLQEQIDEINGEKLSPSKLEKYVQKMLLADAHFLQQSADKIKLGINIKLSIVCPKCGQTYEYLLPITREFLGPTI